MDQKGYYRALTSLKGLFILIIAFHNTLAEAPLFSRIPGADFLIQFGGSMGNCIFFLLSGFLISGNYTHRIQSHGIPVRDFLLRRLKKLYPLYLISNAASLIIEILRYGASAINVEKVIFTILLQGGGGIGTHSPYNRPTWFLSALIVCYLVYYAMCYFAASRTHFISYVTAGIIVGYTAMTADRDLPFLSASNGIAYMNFFLGCLFAEGYPLISEKQHRWLQPLFVVLLPGILYLMLSYGVEIIAGDLRICYSFVMCPMILYLALVKGPCRSILQFRGFAALGAISSGIFFWHLPLYFAFCDVYAALTQGEALREPQYLLYLALLILVSGVSVKLASGKSGAVPAGKGA